MDRIELKGAMILSPALASKDMYIYLHKKHAELVPLLSKALSSMKNDGSYQKLSNKFLKKEMGMHSK